MAYIPNTPLGTQIPAQMFTQFSDNFTELNTQYGSSGDHFEFTAAANNGKHKKVTMPVQAADPTTAANELAFYTKTLGAFSELFLRRDGSGTIIQMTSRNPVVAAGLGASGQTFLPGGVEMKWGTLAVPGGGSASATFTLLGLTAFPNFGIIGFATAFAAPNQFNITNVTQTVITIAATGIGLPNCFWLALGA